MAVNTRMWMSDDNGVWDPAGPQKRLRDDLVRLLGADLAKQTLQVVASHLYVEASEHLLSPPWKGWAQTLSEVARHMPDSAHSQTSAHKAAQGSDAASLPTTHG